jgi:ATP-dependent Lhr-like helicase
MVTCALGGGFTPNELFDEVTDTVGYQDLTRSEFDRALKLAEHGGEALENYDFYHRIEREGERRTVNSRRTGIQHRTTIGTITSDPAVEVRYTNNHRLGTVEESFISKVKQGERFIFAGKLLELVKIKDLTAYVKKAEGSPTQIPRWLGGRLPISTSLSAALRSTFGAIRDGDYQSPEVESAAPILEAQKELSEFPGEETTLCEILETDEGHHLFIYPFEGRLVHEGLAALLALRMSRRHDMTFALSANEYGVEMLAPEPFPWRKCLNDQEALFSTENLADDARESINMGELAKRQFRGVARVAGLVFEGYPGSRKTQGQLQTSSGLLYEVFRKWDPENLLLQQARREVLETHFEQSRLAATLQRISESSLEVHDVSRPTPFGFPLLIERINARLSNESLRDRIERMKETWTTA